MAKKERINKHPDWRLSRSEKNWYYVGDTARLFCTSLVGSYMTAWMLYKLTGNEEAETVFLGKNAEILTNKNWQDVEKNR